ncbi:uncharacterized protein B0H18DRAFT_1214231 [Fomitopsis serialis]|uniref:uncharacterized protein n=1 Tax=Fomitopsis serialis TaxID=139415 RepID=UPI0020089090|nr:uncharacterized protein B0H18DRAFT_1108944 [Neoantrodia serialis]XP_047888896.1 uncharacterized protein B0H18DRAFT_1214231 [Neoantrodia serialis]KAH9912885.1 hypothetical protein B0H18DRAFT_1108944 [Neoantrodia serialis]KAH9918322.1 hypothetical protein B0H18DRAFT_1214231 [Neoantrodia serialis]
MHHCALTSAVLLVAATAIAFAHPIAIRSAIDASIVERGLQDRLVERSYYDDFLSDFEARDDKVALEIQGPKPIHPRVKALRKALRKERKHRGTYAGTPSRSTVYDPRLLHPQHRGRSDYDEIVERNLGARKPWRPARSPSPWPNNTRPIRKHRQQPRSDYVWFAREYEPDGELFGRGFEVDELDRVDVLA